MEQIGVGAISAAQVLVSWSHPGRFRSEAAFATFAGTAPIPASSGLTNRHRLNQWRPSTQPSAPHHHPRPGPRRPRHPRLHRPPHLRGQVPT
ncbi:transposase [Nonomuraea thailandensis]|nr:transposase [Nonomuraea thailandensis]